MVCPNIMQSRSAYWFQAITEKEKAPAPFEWTGERTLQGAGTKLNISAPYLPE
jgi:hypothetical protein